MSALVINAARPSVVAPRRTATQRPLLRAPAASDVGRYLSDAAAGLFRPQADSVPWQSQAFQGKIVHHEETARLKALEMAVDSAVKQIEQSMDEVPAEGDETTTYKFDDKGELVGDDSSTFQYIQSTIQRVFSNNFKGDPTEPTEWVSTGYAASGRHRSQRSLRNEYERLQRFQTVVKKVVANAEAEAN